MAMEGTTFQAGQPCFTSKLIHQLWSKGLHRTAVFLFVKPLLTFFGKSRATSSPPDYRAATSSKSFDYKIHMIQSVFGEEMNHASNKKTPETTALDPEFKRHQQAQVKRILSHANERENSQRPGERNA
jgi:hypothetical protein